jgi:xanthine dehydrogenase accessory factor
MGWPAHRDLPGDMAMSDIWTRLAGIVAQKGAAALVTVLSAAGSAPREAGARMIVAADGSFAGTIGGGQLEWEAIQLAAGRLKAGSANLCRTDFALGPDLGQCCGGRVDVAVELFAGKDLPEIESYAGLEASGGFACETCFDPALPHGLRTVRDVEAKDPGVVTLDKRASRYFETFADAHQPLLLFGAGHVGRALVLALATLPFRVTWIDSRPDAFPKAMPQTVTPVRAQRPAALIADAAAGSFVLVMTHSHPLDLELCRAALSRPNFPYVGVIGSDTKRARFAKRLSDSGLDARALDRLHCPIGISGIDGKAPAVIAASVAAELLLIREALAKTVVDKGQATAQTVE